MKKMVSLMMVLWPCSAIAATDCRVIEYPDHSEVLCVGDAEESPAVSQKTGQEQIPGQEQTVVSAQASEPELPDVPPEKIVRNDLARTHAAQWLKSNPGQ